MGLKPSKRFERMKFVEDHDYRMDSPPCHCSDTNKWCVLKDAEYYEVEYVGEDGTWAADAARVVKAIHREVARGNFIAEFDKALWNEMVYENPRERKID